MTLALQTGPTGVTFAVKVVPNSSKARVVGLLGEALKVAVTAPPEQGKANAAVCALLAATLGVDRRTVQITAGHQNAHKRVTITGLDAATLRQRLGLPT